MKTKIIVGLVLAILFMGLIPMASAEEGVEVVDFQIVEIGHKNLTFFDKYFSFLWVLGTGDIQLGTSVISWGNPPTLGGVSTSFTEGDKVEVLFTVRNVQGGAWIWFDFCEGGVCRAANIFYEPGKGYEDYIRIEGDWDLWWVVGTFTAENSAKIQAVEPIWETPTILASKSFTVTPVATPTPTPTPDPCLGVTCPDKCSGDVRQFNGYCSGGNCYYPSSQGCSHGCSGGVCNADPCLDVNCPNYCSGSTLFYGGYCSGGDCQYSQRNCNYGCSGGVCNPTPTATPTPTPTSTPVPTPTPTPNGTPTPTPTGTPDPYQPIIPGFEAVFAIAGSMVAYLVLRRKNGEI